MKLFITISILFIVSCTSDDKPSCSDLNIQDPNDTPCEELAVQLNCNCD